MESLGGVSRGREMARLAVELGRYGYGDVSHFAHGFTLLVGRIGAPPIANRGTPSPLPLQINSLFSVSYRTATAPKSSLQRGYEQNLDSKVSYGGFFGDHGRFLLLFALLASMR